MKSKLTSVFILLVLTMTIKTKAEDGKTIFKQNCGACHTIGKGRLTGPDLKNVNNKHAEEWMMKWIKSSQTLVESGDSAAVAVYNEFNKIPMTDFAFLSDNDIRATLEYIKTESENVSAVASFPSAPVSANKNITTGNPDTFFNYIWSWPLIIILLLIIVLLGKVIQNLSHQLKKEYAKNDTGVIQVSEKVY